MEKELWKGNEAIAEAAIRAGCDCFFGYPITPAERSSGVYVPPPARGTAACFVQAEI